MMHPFNQQAPQQPLLQDNDFATSVFFATCSSGFEQALQEELNEIYTTFQIPAEVEIGSAGCYITGGMECCLLANLMSFCASRILMVVLNCYVETEEELATRIKELNWPSLFHVKKTFSVKSNVAQSFLQNSMYLSLKVKDAICDNFVEHLKERPNIDTKNPDVKVYVRLVRNEISVSLDTSGHPLFMRGYKTNSNEAPLKETLAACLLRMSGWNKLARSIMNSSEAVYFERVSTIENQLAAQNLDLVPEEKKELRKIPRQVLLSPFFLDQFCGSGTIVVEAALALLHYNPNCNREHFGFMNLFPLQMEIIQNKFEKLKKQLLTHKKSVSFAKECIAAYAKKNEIQFYGENFFPLIASDISESVLHIAKTNAKNAGVHELISFSCKAVHMSTPHASCGLIVINPPYGERIGSLQNLPTLYKTIGDTWKKKFPNWTAWLLSSNESLTKSVGLRSTRKFSVYNGNLECRFLQYVMYPMKSQ